MYQKISPTAGLYMCTATNTLTLVGPGTTGTVTSVSVTSANGFAGSVANATTTPAITLSTTITGLIKGNGTALSAATSGTDYSAGTSALATGILKSTTGTGALSIAVAGDFPTLNQNTTGSAASLTTARTINGDSFDGTGNIQNTLASSDFANQGTTTTVLHGNASGNPSFGAVSLTTDVSGTLPVANGGTGVTAGLQVGTTAAGEATAGTVGEVLESVVAFGSAVSLSTNTNTNVTSKSLTAGDWDCVGIVDFSFDTTTSYTKTIVAISPTSAGFGGAQDDSTAFVTAATIPGATTISQRASARVNISSTTTYFLVARPTFTVSTLTAYGTLRCRRAR